MDGIDKAMLLKELKFYSCLLKKHEALEKEKELKSSISHQSKLHQNPSKSKPFHNYSVMKNQANQVSFNQRYSLKRSSNFNIPDQKKRTVIYNQNQDFKTKYALSKNKISNCTSSANKAVGDSNILTSNACSVHEKSITSFGSESKSNKGYCVSSDGSGKLTHITKDFMEELESLTELLKKKTSRNQPKLSNSLVKCDKVAQDMPLKNKNYKYAFNNRTPIKKESVLSKTKSVGEKLPRISTNVKNFNNKNCYTKINSNNRSNPHQLKMLSPNKFVYKKENINESLIDKTIATSLKDVSIIDKSKSKLQKNTLENLPRTVAFSDSECISDNLCSSANVPTSVLKSSTYSMHEFGKKISASHKTAISSKSNMNKQSSNVNKLKSPILFKMKLANGIRTPMVKLKQGNTRYTKINEPLKTPNEVVQVKYPTQHKSSSKKFKRKLNSKYKVINKIATPNLKKKKVNSLSSSAHRRNSPSFMDSDDFLKNLNDSAIDKLEQNLLAISSELTATPISGKSEVYSNKILQHSLDKGNSRLFSKKAPLKEFKIKRSKYKIVNSGVSQKYSVKKRQNLINSNSGFKKLKQSKFSVINKPMQPVCTLTTSKQERSVLVKRLFKSKNVIINKNVSPTNYSAKMIKSKYLTLNKRKSPNWQKHNAYPRVSLHPKSKGYFITTKMHSKRNAYRMNAVYHPTVNGKLCYNSQPYKSKQLHRSSSRRKSNRMINRYATSPVVFIRGTRYTMNRTGKALRKLPLKGQTSKNYRRISGKITIRSPECLKTSTVASTTLASRVLHRSISRVLTASSKKNLSKVNTYCMFYNRFGRCNRGVKCTYIHDPSKIAVCTRFLRGTCKIDGCPFSHEVDPGKMAICSFFLVGKCEKENCLYRHEKLSSDTVLCKEFVQGYCHNGKKCNKAHILICPKYMQGECNEGSSCNYPHPPQKAKKNVQKEIEDQETKPTEVLLEKVLRYFQQGGDSTLSLQSKLSEKNTSSLFVPKQKKLEEQPSFIPLCGNHVIQTTE